MEKIIEILYHIIQSASGEDSANSIFSLSEGAQLAFFNLLQRNEYPKGAILNTPGKAAEEVYIIEQGLICNYMLVDGKEIGAGFYAEGGIGGDIISFLTRNPSKRTVKVMEPAVVWTINHAELENFYRNFAEAERIGRLLYNYVILVQQNRIEDLVSDSAQIRYRKLQERFPRIIHRLPLQFVATFLGITQETLSRIRAQKD